MSPLCCQQYRPLIVSESLRMVSGVGLQATISQGVSRQLRLRWLLLSVARLLLDPRPMTSPVALSVKRNALRRFLLSHTSLLQVNRYSG